MREHPSTQGPRTREPEPLGCEGHRSRPSRSHDVRGHHDGPGNDGPRGRRFGSHRYDEGGIGDRAFRHEHDAHDHDGPRHRHGGRGGPGGPGFPGRRGHRGDGRRAQRGDVRTAVLMLLAEGGPMHGYQLIQQISERTQGVWRPSPGAIYPALSLLEDEGLVTITQDAGRKQVEITDAGRAELERAREQLGDPFEAIAGQGIPPLRGLFEEVAIATRQIGRSGTKDQAEQAQRLLADTRRGLYLILAGEPAGTAESPAGTPESSATTDPDLPG